jgi:hypothetical protein
VYGSFKTRAHLAKLNTENLRKACAAPANLHRRGDDELAKDLAQVSWFLIST